MKLAKLSLAAIIAVGALSTVNAAPLEEAIKGVELSGFMRYRFEDTSVTAGSDSDVSNYRNISRYSAPFKFTAPVADNLKATAVVRGEFRSSGRDIASTNDDGVTSDYAQGTNALDFSMTKLFFTYSKDGLMVKAGKQSIITPITDGGYAGQRGDGALVTYTMGKITFAGAYFMQTTGFMSDTSTKYGLKINQDTGAYGTTLVSATSKESTNDLATIAVIGSFGPVNAQAWVFTLQDLLKNAYFVQVDGKFAGVGIKAQIAGTKAENDFIASTSDQSGSFYGIAADYSTDAFRVGAGYTTTGKNNGVYELSADSGSTIKAGKQAYYVSSNAADTDVMFLTAGASFGKIGLDAGYVHQKHGSDADVTGVATDDYKVKEFYGQVSYKYSKNFNTYVYYSDMKETGHVLSDDDAKSKKIRFEAKYSF